MTLLFIDNQDAALYAERLAELLCQIEEEIFGGYLLDTLRMWNTISVHMKVRQLQEQYPVMLGNVALSEAEIPSRDTLSLNPSALESASPSASTENESPPSSQESNFKQPEVAKVRTRRVSLDNTESDAGVLTASGTLNILQTLTRIENWDQMLRYFVSQLLMQTGQ
jgi:hypothetical protein